MCVRDDVFKGQRDKNQYATNTNTPLLILRHQIIQVGLGCTIDIGREKEERRKREERMVSVCVRQQSTAE